MKGRTPLALVALGVLAAVTLLTAANALWFQTLTINASVDIGVNLAGRSCEDHGDREHIHISDDDEGADDDEDETPTPSPQPSATATASATGTAVPVQTAASPTSTATSEDGSPGATPTSAADES